MATTGALEAEGFPNTIEYSTSTDQFHDRGRDVNEFPRGRVEPPPAPPGQDKNNKPKGQPKAPPDERPLDSQILADASGTRLAERGHPVSPRPEPKKRTRWLRRLIFFAILLSVIGVILYYAVPEVQYLLSTTSTDDAFVSRHTTNVSPRVEGLITEVMVEKNDRVEAGTVLARLDRQPYEIALNQSEASLKEAYANLDQARAQVKSQLAGARGAYFQRRSQQEQLQRQIKSLEAQVATLRARQSSLHLAELDQRRINALTVKGSASQSELDQRNNTLDVANQQVKEAWTMIQETRAALGLPPNTDNPLDVPKDLLEQQSSIQNAVSSISSSLAQIGIPFDAHDIKPGEAFEQIIHMDSSRGLDEAFGRIYENAPAVKVAKAAVTRSERDVENAKLRLSWTEIRSEIAGYIQDRSANPGNRVEPGDTLISVRPDYLWIEANYKETQLHKIKIGMPVDLYVDAYPGKVFKGRVSGFNAGTGLSETLLPPENATGNYIKVTQRLPVRIELVEPNPKDTPLFAGLSVVPYIKFKEKVEGPDAGDRLHFNNDYRQHPDAGGGPAGDQLKNKPEFEGRELK